MVTMVEEAVAASFEAVLLHLDLAVEALLVARGLPTEAARDLARAHGADAPATPAEHPRFARAARAWELSAWDLDLLLLTLATEMDPRYGRVWTQIGGAPRPTVGLAMDLFAVAEDHRAAALAALGPDRALARFGLIGLAGDGPLVSRHLAPADGIWSRVVAGVEASMVPPEPGLLDALHLAPDERASAVAAVAALRRAGDPPLVFVVGPTGSGREALARAVAGRAGLPALVVGGAADPRDVVRDARWQGAAVLLVGGDPDAGLPERMRIPLFWLATEADRLPVDVGGHRPCLVLRLRRPDAGRRAAVWRRLGAGDSSEALARRYRFGPGRIEEAVQRARRSGGLAQIDRICRELQTARFGALAQRLSTDRDWDEIVVSDAVMGELRLALAWLRHGERVFGTWGMGRRLGASGLACLFCGPPGTGKTLAARVLARALQVDLYRVDLSQTVNKYIGETEKNLARLFDEAREANALLFFDEADAVFGKRTQVKDAHDRYANVETGFLLQRMEEHEGAVILASNLPQNLDEAFMRRLHVVARFDLPDADARERIWVLHLPDAAHCEGDIDVALLGARFEISGGDIRNACLTAALSAAADGERVAMRHVVRGLHRELRKSGRMVDATAFGRWSSAIKG